MNGILRLTTGLAIAALFIAAWVAIAWLVMLVSLYVARVVPMAGWRWRRRMRHR